MAARMMWMAGLAVVLLGAGSVTMAADCACPAMSPEQVTGGEFWIPPVQRCVQPASMTMTEVTDQPMMAPLTMPVTVSQVNGRAVIAPCLKGQAFDPKGPTMSVMVPVVVRKYRDAMTVMPVPSDSTAMLTNAILLAPMRAGDRTTLVPVSCTQSGDSMMLTPLDPMAGSSSLSLLLMDEGRIMTMPVRIVEQAGVQTFVPVEEEGQLKMMCPGK